MFKCWVLHFVIGWLGALALICLFIAVDESPGNLLREARSLRDDFRRQPATMILGTMGIVILIELAHLALACVVVGWGAHDEPIRNSFRHSIRQVWLRTPHALVSTLLILVFALMLNEAGKTWNLRYSGIPWPGPAKPPVILPNDPDLGAKLDTYQKSLQEQHNRRRTATAERMALWESRPWYVRYEEFLVVGFGFLMTAWWLWALLGALGIERPAQAVVRSELCLWCGYDLNLMPPESRCPECGRPVAESLGPKAQPGPAWEKRGEWGWAPCFWNSGGRMMAEPIEFGRRLLWRTPRRDHRVFLVVHLPLIFTIGLGGILALFLQTSPRHTTQDWLTGFLVAGIFGTACVMGTVLVACAVAALVGCVASLRFGRNLLPASMQAACYGATYLALWAIIGATVLWSAAYGQQAGYFRILGDWTGWHRDSLMFLSCFLPNAAGGLLYIVLVGRVTGGARYANR